MAYEPAVIEQWIYETLQGDATLQALLATGNLPPNYQVGVYSMVAPQIGPVSRLQPSTPYIVFGRAGSNGNDAAGLCGARLFTYPVYAVVVWDTQSGAVSAAASQTIMNRVDTLLDNQMVTTTTPRFYCRRESTAQTFALSEGGRTDLGVVGNYKIVTQN